jgi:nicotinic acid mononucleotide adenylyltransferase
MVSIKSGEVNTPKGDNKQMALDTVATLEEKYGSFAVKLIAPLLEAEAGQQSIAVFPGAFKPPHASHLKAIQVIAPKVDKVYVYVSKQPRVKEDQIPIDADQAMAVWDLYKQKGLIPDNVEIKLANNATPVLDAYQEIETHPENKYLAVFGKDEEDRWKSVEKNREKYGHVTPFNIGNLKGLSASDLRTALKNKDVKAIQTFLPKGITAKEYIQVLVGQKKLQEIVTDTEVICDGCGWHWPIADGGDDLYICHKCGHDNTPSLNEVGEGSAEPFTWKPEGNLTSFINNLKKRAPDSDRFKYSFSSDKFFFRYFLHPK